MTRHNAWDQAALARDYLKQADPILAALIDDLIPYPQQQRQTADTLLSALTKAIIYQRISIKAANTVYLIPNCACKRNFQICEILS